jgi:hypothetical protein
MPPKPRNPIRRFDVFAEYRKQEQQDQGTPEDQAKGYGLWVAKVVAARRFGRGRGTDGQAPGGQPEPGQRGKWHELEGQPQTDALFDAEIVARMGSEFYREVFVPAIQQARAHGRSYEAIRDAIRRPWRPA